MNSAKSPKKRLQQTKTHQAKPVFRSTPEWYFGLGQVGLGACLLACLVITPHWFFSFTNQGGISNYGTEPATTGWFVAGFGVAALGAILAALSLRQTIKHQQGLRRALWLIAVLWLLVLFSTFSYKLSPALRQLHEGLAGLVFLYMCIAVFWLWFHVLRDRQMRFVFALFCFSLFIGICCYLKIVRLLFLVEIVCGISFGYMMTHGIKVLRARN